MHESDGRLVGLNYGTWANDGEYCDRDKLAAVGRFSAIYAEIEPFLETEEAVSSCLSRQSVVVLGTSGGKVTIRRNGGGSYSLTGGTGILGTQQAPDGTPQGARAANGNDYALELVGCAWQAVFVPPVPVVVALGASGESVMIQRNEDGSYSNGNLILNDGSTVTASNGNMYKLSIDAFGRWTATYIPMRQVVRLGDSGSTVTVFRAEDGSYWIGNIELKDGDLVVALNGSTYQLRQLSSGEWSAEYIQPTQEVSLLGGAESLTLTRAADGTYRLGTEVVEETIAITHALHGTYKIALDSNSSQWTVEPVPAGASLPAPGLNLETLADTGVSSFGGDGGPATKAQFSNPSGVAVDSSGNVLIADTKNHRIRSVSPSGTISTLAGTGTAGFGGDGGDPTQALLREPFGVSVGPDGRVYIADSGNNRIRVITVDGAIETIAGVTQSGFSGDGGPAGGARLANPSGVAVGRSGELYVADTWNHRIRKIESGVITTVGGTGQFGYGGDGGPALAAALRYPRSVTVDAAGNVYIADTGNHRVRRIGRDGQISSVIGTGTSGLDGDCGPAASASLAVPRGVLAVPDGSLYVADSGNNAVRRIGTDGVVTTVIGTGSCGASGDDVSGSPKKLNNPVGIALGNDGQLVVADSGNHRVRHQTPGWNIFSAEELPSPVHVPLGELGDWARLWRTHNSTYYHKGRPFETGGIVFGWEGEPYRLEDHFVSGWLAEPTQIDYAARFRMHHQAALEGEPEAQGWLGFYYFFGLGIGKDSAEAAHWFRLGAEQGNTNAEFWLAWMHAQGDAVPRDAVKAAELYGRAARKGDARAQYELGWSYWLGDGVKKDLEEGARWILRAAMQDNARAQQSLGYMYRDGLGVAQSDSESFQWYRLAATQGNPWAQVSLGVAHLRGIGIPQDVAEGLTWIRRAADRGNVLGYKWLGWLYENGEAVQTSATEAVKWYRRASVEGDAWTQWRLGLAYMRGFGTAQNDVAALVWLGLARANGEEEAEEPWETVRARLTPDQLREANALGSECLDSGYQNCP